MNQQPLSQEALKSIGDYCRNNWARAHNQSEEDARYIQDVAISAMIQALKSPHLLKLANLYTLPEMQKQRLDVLEKEEDKWVRVQRETAIKAIEWTGVIINDNDYSEMIKYVDQTYPVLSSPPPLNK